MAALRHVRLTDRLACQGGAVTFGFLRPEDLLEAHEIVAVDDTEQLTLVLSQSGADGARRSVLAELRAGRILTVVLEDDTWTEWRLHTIDDGRGTGGKVTLVAVALQQDLTDRADSAEGLGWVSTVVDGRRTFTFTITDRTPAEIWDAFVIPNCPSWVSAGTVTPDTVLPSLAITQATPWALALAVRDAIRAQGTDCELQLHRNGTTDYQLDLVAAIGADAPVPLFHPIAGLLTNTRHVDPADQTTRVLVIGGAAPDGLPGFLGRARWAGSAPTGTTLPLRDRNGGPGPIGFDGQWVGAYLYRVATGRTFAIVSSDATAQTVTLDAISNITADEDFEFRLTEPLTHTRTLGVRHAISAVSSGVVRCAVAAPLTVDHQHRDWYARIWDAASDGAIVATLRILDSTAATQAFTVASTAGITTAHFLEILQLDGAGERPSHVDHPTAIQPDPIGYGVKAAALTAPALGIVQLVPNAWLREWSDSHTPTGWNVAGAGTLGFTEDPLYTRYGARAAVADWSSVVLTSPPIYPTRTTGTDQIALRARVLFTAMTSVGGDFTFSVTLHARAADGSAGAVLATTEIRPGDSAASDLPKVAPETWATMEIVGLVPPECPFGMVAVVKATATSTGQCVGVLDTLELFPFTGLPEAAYEFGDAAALLQAGNRTLRQKATPPISYELTLLDLARGLGVDYARMTLTLGGGIRVVDPAYGVDQVLRLLRLERNLLAPQQTQCTVAVRRPLLSDGDSAAVDPTTPDLPPVLDVIATPGETAYEIAWRGADVVTVSIDGNPFGPPPATPFTVERPEPGVRDRSYNFRATRGKATISNSITVPAIGRSGTTLEAYAIGNAYTKTEADARYALLGGSNATGTWPIGISGNASTVTNGVYTSGSYSNPSWITALAAAKISAGTFAGSFAFSSVLSADISGNAATVTNGVYTSGSYSNPSWITALAASKVTAGTLSGNFAVSGTFAVGDVSGISGTADLKVGSGGLRVDGPIYATNFILAAGSGGGAGSGGSIAVYDNGTLRSSSAASLNFVSGTNATVSASSLAGAVTVTVSASGAVTSVAGRTGVVALTAADIGAGTFAGAVAVPSGDRGFEVNHSGGVSLYDNEVNAGALGGTGTLYLGWRRTASVHVGAALYADAGVIGDVTGNLTGNADTVTHGVYTTGSYSNPSWITALAAAKISAGTFAGSFTFSSLLAADISGNAATVTNGVSTSGSYSNPTWLTALDASKVTGALSGITTLGVSSTITSTLGTITTSTPAWSSTATWNGSGVTFIHHDHTITNTASQGLAAGNFGSALFRYRVGTTHRLTLSHAGHLYQGDLPTLVNALSDITGINNGIHATNAVIAVSTLPVLQMTAISGTFASPAGVTSGQNIGALRWRGFPSATARSYIGAEIRGVTTEAWASTTNGGTRLEFYTTATGTQNMDLALTLGADRSATFYGAVSGVTSLAMSGALSGVTTGAFSSHVTVQGNLTVGVAGTQSGIIYWQYGTDAASRSWVLRGDVDVYGDFQLMQSTTRTGSTYTYAAKWDASRNLTLPASVTAGADIAATSGVVIASSAADKGFQFGSGGYRLRWAAGNYVELVNGAGSAYGNFQAGNLDAAGTIHAGGIVYAPNFTLSSDRRLKRDLEEITGARHTVRQLTGYLNGRVDRDPAYREASLVAQEALAAFAVAVDTSGPYLGLFYDRFIPLLVNALKEEMADNAALRERVGVMDRALDRLERHVA